VEGLRIRCINWGIGIAIRATGFKADISRAFGYGAVVSYGISTVGDGKEF
jgi:hypothetical protein